MNGFAIVAILVFVAVWFLLMAWKSGRLKTLGKELKIGSRGITLTDAQSKGEPYTPRRFEKLTFLVFGLFTFGLAYYVTDYVFLCILYGISRVQSAGLHFTAMPKGHPWIVSNGDQIATNLHPLHFAICAVIWLVTTLVGFVLVRKLLPKREEPVFHQGDRAPKAEPSTQKTVERRSMVEKGRPFRMRAIRFVVCWALTMVLLGVLAQWIGRAALFLIVGTSIIFMIAYIRSRESHFMTMMIATPCPQCGQGPMRYETPRDENGNHHLLICDKCRIEWNLGPV